ncbi:hypothetical protein [Labilibacter marinus]|uniref:hypothetical protein n=1 Tax=Labilibacter marinus TaxID=1477105 RepID=UPI00094F628A|nr:hypothetical protein [Labilibacter marinus]
MQAQLQALLSVLSLTYIHYNTAAAILIIGRQLATLRGSKIALLLHQTILRHAKRTYGLGQTALREVKATLTKHQASLLSLWFTIPKHLQL